MTRYYLEEQRGMHAEPLVLLDHSARVSQQLTLLEEGELEFDQTAKRWRNTRTGTHPLILHGNGLDGACSPQVGIRQHGSLPTATNHYCPRC